MEIFVIQNVLKIKVYYFFKIIFKIRNIKLLMNKIFANIVQIIVKLDDAI